MRVFTVSKSRNSKGFWCPDEIRANPELEWTEKILLIEIINLCKLGECYASNSHFGGYIGVSGDRAGRLVSKLAKLGYIRTKVIYKESKNGKPEVDKRIIAVNTERFSFFTKAEKEMLDSQIPIGEFTDTPHGEYADTTIGEDTYIKKTLPKESTPKENIEILVHDSEKPTVKPTDKESWDSEPLYNKRYGIPINLGEMSDEETDIWYEAIDYFLEKHKQWSIKPHGKHKPDYWRRYTIETSIKICLRGFTVNTELIHRIIDYYFDIERPRGTGEWSMMCSDRNMNGILVKLFGGSRSDRESAGMLEPKEVWEYSFARERELDLV